MFPFTEFFLFPFAPSSPSLSLYTFLLSSMCLGGAAGGEAGWWYVDAELPSSDWSAGYGGEGAEHQWLAAAVAAGASL